MATQRERLIAAGKRQVLLWLDGDVADLLKNLAAADRVNQADLVGRALRSYRGQTVTPAVDTPVTLNNGLESRIAALEKIVAALGRTAPPMTVPAVVQKPATATPLTKRDKQIAAARRHAMASVTGKHPPIPNDLKPAYRRALELFDAGETLARQISKKLANEGHVSKGGKPISAAVIIKLLQDNGRLKRETAV